MNSWQLLIVCTVAWLAWIPAVVMEKRARGDQGYTSIFPLIPLFPLIAWMVGNGLNHIKANVGTCAIGGLHIILLICFIVSVVVSAIRIRMKKP